MSDSPMIYTLLVIIAAYWTWKAVNYFVLGTVALHRTRVAVENALCRAMFFSIGAALLFRYLAASS